MQCVEKRKDSCCPRSPKAMAAAVSKITRSETPLHVVAPQDHNQDWQPYIWFNKGQAKLGGKYQIHQRGGH